MRTREKVGTTKVPYYDKFYEIVNTHSLISDVNNGRKGLRPNSPCYHVESKYSPLIVNSTQYLSGLPLPIFVNAPANSYSKYVDSVTKIVRDGHYDRCVKKMERLISNQIQSFSTLNFLYELRELPDLFRKIRRPQDIRFIDYQFAVMPTLSDLRSALTAYNAQVSSLNDKLKNYRSIECNFTKTELITIDGPVSYFFGNGHIQSDTFRVTTRMRGTIEMDIPILAQVSPELFKILDDLQIDISAGNAWNALPWSWFIDWFVPVGDYLESLPSGMKPLTRFVGTISHTVTGFSDLTTDYTGPAYATYAGQPAGRLQCELYIRTAFSSAISSMIRWSFEPLSKPSQLLILRDIMFPVKRNKSPKDRKRAEQKKRR